MSILSHEAQKGGILMRPLIILIHAGRFRLVGYMVIDLLAQQSEE